MYEGQLFVLSYKTCIIGLEYSGYRLGIKNGLFVLREGDIAIFLKDGTDDSQTDGIPVMILSKHGISYAWKNSFVKQFRAVT